jgi:zinc protease
MRSLLCAALLVALPAGAVEPTTLHVPFTRFVLPNGLTVILHEDHRAPTVVVNLWFKVGSKDERPGRTGFAHLFEHLMFMGTRRVPNGEFDTIMESQGGANDASTSQDRTNYYESGPSHLLETFLWLEADRLATLPEAMTQAKVDLQREVVKNERREGYENRPYGRVDLVLQELLYPPSHPYHHPVIGSHADLSAAGVADVKAFFRAYYVPANASLVVSGDFDAAATRRLVEKYFAWMPRAPRPPHASPPPAHLARPVRARFDDDVSAPRVVLAWLSPPEMEPGDAECDLLAALLGKGQSSRLYRALVHDQRIAQSVEVEQDSGRYGSQLIVTVTAQPGHDAGELERAVDAELRALQTSPPDAGELERARAAVEVDTLREIESPARLADQLNYFEYRFGDPAQLEQQLLARYDRVTPAGLASWAARVLAAPRATVVVVPRDRARGNAAGAGATGGASQ